MKKNFIKVLLLLIIKVISITCLAENIAIKQSIITNLKANYRNGQVFITWDEKDLPSGSTLNVYMFNKEITDKNLSQATKIGHHIEPHSATDWTVDYGYVKKGATHSKPVGFVIETGCTPLDPMKGLFVHTITKKNLKNSYYAVTTSSSNGKENNSIKQAANSLIAPVKQKIEPIQPIYLGKKEDIGTKQAALYKSPEKQPLVMFLHALGGPIFKDKKLLKPANMQVFLGPEYGWREGLVFKFHLHSYKKNFIRIKPIDRAWIHRAITPEESSDVRDHTPAVNTFWYGYNEYIYDNELRKKEKLLIIPNATCFG